MQPTPNLKHSQQAGILNTGDETLKSASYVLCTIRWHSNTLLAPLFRNDSMEKPLQHFEKNLASVALVQQNFHQMNIEKLPLPMKMHEDIHIWHALMSWPIYRNSKIPHFPQHIWQDMQRVCTYDASIGWSNNVTAAYIHGQARLCLLAIHQKCHKKETWCNAQTDAAS